MSKIRTTVWKLEPHTAAKHAILRRYLDAWIPIMSRWNGKVLYVDGFAGPGVYEGGEAGSPIIALKAAAALEPHLSQMSFLFIEAQEDRFKRLCEELSREVWPDKLKIVPILGRFDQAISDLLDLYETKRKKLIPTFAFIDPFGFSHTPMSLIRRIMQNPRCEVLVTFMYEEVNRFLEHDNHPTTFDELFGCQDWRSCLADGGATLRERCIRELYQNQLSTAAGISYVRTFKMKNKHDRTDYFLFFGTNSLKGLAKMKESMWRVDQEGTFEFSDATDPSQTLLFERAPDFDLLRRMLRDGLAGQVITAGQVEEFVLVSTPFTASHYKGVLRGMELADPPELVARTARSGRKRGTFADPTMKLEFLD